MKVEKLIKMHSKLWLANELGITRVTLDRRLIHNDWKKGELLILKNIKI